MKFLTVFYFVCFFAYGQSKHTEITFTILNKSVKDNDTIDLEIKNHSSKKYYLPIIQNDLSDRLKFEFETFFFFKTVVEEEDGKALVWCNEDIMNDCEELRELWNIKKRNLSINDFIILRPNQNLKLKIPFHTIIKVCDYMKWSIINPNPNGKKFFQIVYGSPDITVLNHFLIKKNMDQIVKMRYNLYQKVIISNKVPFLFD